MLLVDTNVLVDVLKADPVWMTWSAQQLVLARTATAGQGLRINLVIYAELAAHPEVLPSLDAFLDDLGIGLAPMGKPVARLAAAAFTQYRQRGGSKTGVLPDFLIGAQAQAEGWALLTRDKARYQTYFPQVQLIAP